MTDCYKYVLIISSLVFSSLCFAEEADIPVYTMALMAPWSNTFEDFSARTSAGAVSIAMRTVHTDPKFNQTMRLR